MNTATTCATNCPTTPTRSTRAAVLQRLQWRLAGTWAAWRRQSRLHAELRALEGLSDATLRDIGLSDRVLQQPGLSALAYERGRW